MTVTDGLELKDVKVFSHGYSKADERFSVWIYQQKERYHLEKCLCDDLIVSYMKRTSILEESRWDSWLREQVRKHEQKNLREIQQKYDERIARIESAEQMRQLFVSYERELRQVGNQYHRYFQEEHHNTQETTISVSEQNVIVPVVISPQIKIQLEQVKRDESHFLNWLHEQRSSEKLTGSVYFKFLHQHVEGQSVPGWPQPAGDLDDKYSLDSEEQDVIKDLQDNLQMDIEQVDGPMTKNQLNGLLKRYRRQQCEKLIDQDKDSQEEEEAADSVDHSFIGCLMEDIEEGNGDKIPEKVHAYLMKFCEQTPGGEDIHPDRETIEEFFRHPAQFSSEDVLARIQLLKLLLGKKMKDVKGKIKEGNERKLVGLMKRDRQYIGQLSPGDLEDRGQLAKDLGEQLDISDEESQEDETKEKLCEVKTRAEEEIRGHSGDLTSELLLGLMEKYRKLQLGILNTECDAEPTEEEEVDGPITDAEYVNKISDGDVDIRKLAELLRQRFTDVTEPEVTESDREIKAEIASEMGKQLLDREGHINKRDVLALLLKCKHRHQQALKDRKFKAKEDVDFVEGLKTQKLQDLEYVLGRVLDHIRHRDHLLLGEVAQKFAANQKHLQSNTEGETEEIEAIEPVPGMNELREDHEYGQKLDALNVAVQKLLEQDKNNMTKEHLQHILMEHRMQITLLLENKRNRDEMKAEKDDELLEKKTRDSITSDKYHVLVEEYEAEHEQLKVMRANEKSLLQERFQLILEARLRCKTNAKTGSDTEDETELLVSEAIAEKQRGEITEEAFLALMRQHMLEKLSLQEHRRNEKSRLQEKLKLALESRRQARDQPEEEEGEQDPALKTVEKKFRAELNDTVTESQAQELIKQYRNQRESLIERKAQEKKKQNDRLKDRLKEKEEINQANRKHKPTEEDQKEQMKEKLEEHNMVRMEKRRMMNDGKKVHDRKAQDKLRQKKAEGKFRKKEAESPAEEADMLDPLLCTINTRSNLAKIFQNAEETKKLKLFINQDTKDDIKTSTSKETQSPEDSTRRETKSPRDSTSKETYSSWDSTSEETQSPRVSTSREIESPATSKETKSPRQKSASNQD